jgi:hypothetical protein
MLLLLIRHSTVGNSVAWPAFLVLWCLQLCGPSVCVLFCSFWPAEQGICHQKESCTVSAFPATVFLRASTALAASVGSSVLQVVECVLPLLVVVMRLS